MAEPRAYDLSDSTEIQRLLREVEGYMRTSLCHGTDTSGRGFALDAQWRDIADAPKDGTQVLGWNEEGAEIVWWEDACTDQPDQPGHDGGWFGTYAFPGRNKDDRYHSESQGQPTHWMPLPTPPERG